MSSVGEEAAQENAASDESKINSVNVKDTSLSTKEGSSMNDQADVKKDSYSEVTTADHGKKEGSTAAEWSTGGVFSGWGFDVNSMANNMNLSNLFSTRDSVGGLFASPDSVGGFYGPSDSAEIGNEQETQPNSTDGRSATDHAKKGRGPVTNEEKLGTAAVQIANAATVELEQASRAAQATFGKAAEEIGRGWGSLNTFLDDILASDASRSKDGVDTTQDIHTTFRKLFPNLDSDDEVVDHYRCTMLQKYRCYLNNATPEKTFPLRGRLFVTMSNIAMYITDDGGLFGENAFGVNVPFQDVVKIQKGAKSMLRVVTKSQTSFIFAEFESETHYDGALSLLEQLGAAAASNITSGDTSAPMDSASNIDNQNTDSKGIATDG